MEDAMGADLIYGEVWHWMGRFLFKVTSGMPDCSIHSYASRLDIECVLPGHILT